ncbi:MAG: DJ-1/PfpI family protein [Alphaproteobacteria bacterium]|nr:DJ-1/PfpI family protein [Alphaproteobacteria bacterium]
MSYAILIYDGVEPIDIGATFGVLSMASRRIPGLAFFGVARERGPVKCAGGLTLEADHDFQSCPAASNLIVTGGPGWLDAARDRSTLAFLRDRAADRATRVSAICTGAMILAAAGLLEGRTAATKQEVFEGEVPPAELLAEMSVDVRPAAVVDSGGIITGGGVTLGIDVMFHLLTRDHGADASNDVARVMEYARARDVNREALGYMT